MNNTRKTPENQTLHDQEQNNSSLGGDSHNVIENRQPTRPKLGVIGSIALTGALVATALWVAFEEDVRAEAVKGVIGGGIGGLLIGLIRWLTR